MTRTALAHAFKLGVLHEELLSHERIQIHAARDDISPRQAGRLSRRPQLLADRRKDLAGEKCDLTFVVRLEVKEPVAEQAPPGHTFDLLDRQRRMIAWRLFVMTEKIVPGRDEDSRDADRWRARHGGDFTGVIRPPQCCGKRQVAPSNDSERYQSTMSISDLERIIEIVLAILPENVRLPASVDAL